MEISHLEIPRWGYRPQNRHDRFWLAHLLRLGILPTGYIYPKEQRGVRDLLRRRAGLVRIAAGQLISIQSQIWPSSGVRIPGRTIQQRDFQARLEDRHDQALIASGLAVLRTTQHEIRYLSA